MSAKEVIRYRKVVSYPMPEELWDNMESWYEDLVNKMENLNPSVDLGADRSYGSKIVKLTKKALQLRLDNKNEITGDYGYGKVFRNIIGEYKITLEDEEGLQKKIMILESILDIFNQDEKIIYFDPLASKQEGGKTQFDDITAEEAVEISLLLNAIKNPSKLSVGSSMGFINRMFPHLKGEMKNIAPMMGKQLGQMKGRIKSEGIEPLQEDLEVKYSAFLKVDFEQGGGPAKLKEPLTFIFKYDEDQPKSVFYELDEEVYEVPLIDMIKKMKHDKVAYEYLHQHKPGGPLWPDVASGEYCLVISNDPFLNLTKSSGRHWANSSCERLSTSSFQYSQGGISDTKYGNCIAFAFDASTVNEEWPEKQPKKDIILGRQNLKWGYKENKEGVIGIGLDPMFYPRAGGSRWAKLLNRALALIIDSHGYLDYTSLKTPYRYEGHCDVGSGIGLLTYTAGTTCYTNIKQDVVDPNLLVAANRLINSHQFERLSRPLSSLDVKMLLAQNPNIWALPNREVGIGRLIRLKNLELTKFLVQHETADPSALLGILEILPELDPDYDNAEKRTSLTFLICNHYNATSEIHNKILEIIPTMKLEGKRVDTIDVLFGGLGNRGNVDPLTTHSPYVNYGDLTILKETIKRAKRKKIIINKLSLARSILYAPSADNEVYREALKIIRNNIRKVGDDFINRIALEVLLSFSFPLNVKGSWCFNQKPYGLDFDISLYKRRIYEIDRQSENVLNDVMYVLSLPFITENNNNILRKILIENLRDSEVFNVLWRRRKRYGFFSYLFTRYSRDPLNFEEPSSLELFGSKELIAALNADELYELKYDFVDGENKQLRKTIPSKFANKVLDNNSYIEALGWGYVALWLSNPKKHFGAFQERVFNYAFDGLYLGDGKFDDPPENPFELYDMIDNINTLQAAAVDSVLNEGGISRNTRIPMAMQDALVGNWNALSLKYGGSYDEYLDNIIEALCNNPATSSRLLYDFSKSDKMKKYIASNPSCPKRLLNKLFKEYPVEVLSNPALSDVSFNKFWKYTLKILRMQIDKDINELFNKFEVNSILDRNKGSKYRKAVHKFLSDNKNMKYWRAGLIKKGIWNDISALRVSEEGIADFPLLFETGKTLIIKFNNEPDKSVYNEVYEVDELKTIDEATLFIRGRVHKWKDDVKIIEDVNENILINDLFNYIPESERIEEIITTDEEGGEVVVKAPRWTIDNIIVVNDPLAITKGEKVPPWRFDITTEDCKQILKGYVKRDDNIQQLIDDLSIPIMSPNYELTQKMAFKVIEEENRWTRELINDNISLLLSNNAEILNSIEDLPLTKLILNLSLADTNEEIKEVFNIPDLSITVLEPLQLKILSYDYVPIAYIYEILHKLPPANITAAGDIQRMRRQNEYNRYYEETMAKMKGD